MHKLALVSLSALAMAGCSGKVEPVASVPPVAAAPEPAPYAPVIPEGTGVFAQPSTLPFQTPDFSKIKELVNRFDHALINDVMGDINPTAENMAKWLCDRIPHCVRVSVQETEGNVATYEK